MLYVPRVQTCFHGVDLSSMREAAMKEYFRQPIVDTFDMRICMAKSVRHSVDFSLAHESDLHRIGKKKLGIRKGLVSCDQNA